MAMEPVLAFIQPSANELAHAASSSLATSVSLHAVASQDKTETPAS